MNVRQVLSVQLPMHSNSSTSGSTALSNKLFDCIKDRLFKKDVQYNLVALHDDWLLIWNKEKGCLYSQILNVPSGTADSGKVQVLALSHPPLWEVYSIVVNNNGTAVLIYGREGAAVVQLPKMWGSHSLFEGGSETITCRAVHIGQKFYACHQKNHIICARWHPGSLDHQHIAVLSTDSYFRVFNVASPDIPDEGICVGSSASFVLLPSSGRKGGTECTGESPVSFDFGVHLPCRRKNDSETQKKSLGAVFGIEEYEDEKKRILELQWPVFILYGNGDVYYILSFLTRKRPVRKTLFGPLKMRPSSFDNYGLDFCSLLTLPCSPPVVVIANRSGRLHHCIALDSVRSNSINQDVMEEDSCEHVFLHVYESVQLDISKNKEKVDSEYVSLMLDTNTASRYWVSHADGVHGIALPLVEHLVQFSELPEDSPFASEDLECHIEHLVSTRLYPDSSSQAVVGLAISSTPPNIYVALASGTIHSFPLPSMYIPYITANMDVEYRSTVGELSVKKERSSFLNHVRNLLHRTHSQPLLLSGQESALAPQAYLSLLNQVTENLRTYYIQPQRNAREDIEKRLVLLIGQKKLLEHDMKYVRELKTELKERAHALAEKYEETSDRQKLLVNRLEKIIGSLVERNPVLSPAEKSLQKELESVADKVPTLSSELNQIKSTYEWQKDEQSKHLESENRLQNTSALSDSHLRCLKPALRQESEKLEELVKKVRRLKMDMCV